MQSSKNQCKFEQIRVDVFWEGPGWEERVMPSFWCKTISGVVLPRHWLIPVMLENAEAAERDETLMSCSLPHPWKRIISSALWVLPPPPSTLTQWARVVHMAVCGWMDSPCRKVWPLGSRGEPCSFTFGAVGLHVEKGVSYPECVETNQPFSSTWGHRSHLQEHWQGCCDAQGVLGWC